MPLSNERRASLMGGSYITKLRDHEELLAKLYTAFANAFPNDKKFWTAIAKQEMYHMQMVETMEAKVKSGEWSFQRPDYLYGHITDSIEWITRLINRIENSGMTLQEALHIAITAEKSIIETKYMDFVLENSDPDAARILKTLKEETKTHIEKIEKEASRLKWRFFGKKKRTASTHTVIETANSMEEAKQAQKDILQCLVTLEENISTLYATFEKKLPEYADFWARYSAEEMQHSSMIKSLFDYLEKGHLFKNIGAFDKEQLIKDIEFVLDAEHTIRYIPITMEEALNTALKVETMISEGSFYCTVESSAPEYQHICSRMRELLTDHKQRLHSKIIEIGKQK